MIPYLLFTSLAWGGDPIAPPITSVEVPEEGVCRAALIISFPCYGLPDGVDSNRIKCETFWAGEAYQCLVTLNSRVPPLTVFTGLEFQEVTYKRKKLSVWTIRDDRGTTYPLHSIETIKVPLEETQ